MTPRDIYRAGRLSILLCVVLLAAFVLFLIFQVDVGILGLQPFGVHGWSGVYALFTYWTVHPGLLSWLIVSASFVMSGLILERMYSTSRLVLLLAGGFIAGGLAYATFESTDAILVGAAMGAWAYGGAAMTVVIRRWKSWSLLAKLYAIYLATQIAFTFDSTGVGIAQSVSIILGVGFALFTTPIARSLSSIATPPS